MLNKEHPLFDSAIKWVREFPGGLSEKDKVELRETICATFGITNEVLLASTNGHVDIDKGIPVRSPRDIETSLRKLIPPGGFYDRYCTFTERSEAPLVYHLFSALVAIGATVGRRVWFDMGIYQLFPNLCIIILGPSGIKKTSASNIAVHMLQFLGQTKVYSEKLTPEQLVESLKENAQGLIYAPEMAVFLGRQRYMEGVIPLITRLMDCPNVWSSETIGRGKTTLNDVAVSSIMCSTVDWFVNNTTEDMVGGGFIPRNILVAQDDSPRSEDIPRAEDPKEKERIILEISAVHDIKGQMSLAPNVRTAHREWYHSHKIAAKSLEHEILSTYYQRKPDHAKRVAFCLHLAEHNNLTLCIDCFTRAINILDWVEGFIPGLLQQMFKTSSGHSSDLVLNAIRASGGVIDHSEMLRRLQYRFNAAELKPILNGLRDSGQVDEHLDKLQHVWYIRRRGSDT